MSQVRIIADLHLGHRNICKYRPCDSVHEHEQLIIDGWNRVVGKRDVVYVLGDAVFESTRLHIVDQLRGRKILVRGNHDKLKAHEYLSVFEDILGIKKYHGTWLSHAPIHPRELRGCFNIHGHVHNETVPDNRYFNACIENIGYEPILFQEIINILESQ